MGENASPINFMAHSVKTPKACLWVASYNCHEAVHELLRETWRHDHIQQTSKLAADRFGSANPRQLTLAIDF